jgi:hypothetical protein
VAIQHHRIAELSVVLFIYALRVEKNLARQKLHLKLVEQILIITVLIEGVFLSD